MDQTALSPAPHEAVVTRTPATEEAPLYLKLDGSGQAIWIADPGDAVCFASMREAARMAFRLPAELRAFGMPLDVEKDVYAAVH